MSRTPYSLHRFASLRDGGVCLLELSSLVLLVSVESASAKRVRRFKTEVSWLGVDSSERTISGIVRKPGRGHDDSQIQVGKQASWKLRSAGEGAGRTVAVINGRKAELTEIAKGLTARIHWTSDGKERTAHKVDVVTPSSPSAPGAEKLSE